MVLDGDVDAATRIRVLDRIVDEVREDLVDRARVRPGSGGALVAHAHLHAQLAVAGLRVAHEARRQLSHVDERGLELRLAALDGGELEQVVHDVGEPPRMAVDDLEIGLLLLG
jgi:hypothetical protein